MSVITKFIRIHLNKHTPEHDKIQLTVSIVHTSKHDKIKLTISVVLLAESNPPAAEQVHATIKPVNRTNRASLGHK